MVPRKTQNIQAKSENFTQQWVRLSLLCGSALSVLSLSACSTNSSYTSLAPAPPTPLASDMTGPDIDSLADIETASGATVRSAEYRLGVKSETQVPSGCRTKDRFDRKHLVSYQWGQKDRSLVGFDVDGIGFDSMEIEAVKLEYRFRFQPIKKKKERCRYKSSWQGLAPTGYHELFVREGDTVWKDLKKANQRS